MNIKENILKIFLGMLCLIIFHNSSYGKDNYVANLNESITEDLLIERINKIDCPIDIKITSELKKIIRQYTYSNRRASEVVLGKTSIYFPLFESILKSENLPVELKFLSVVESGLKQDAKSKVGAVGLWQFMKGTGKHYGLKINNTVDQRIDPTLSTKAAAKFLKDLYSQFGDWTLAMAAYNCGPGNVRKAIRKSGSKDYWVLQKYLPKETKRYIPKFIAMIYLHTYHESYDLVPKQTENKYSDIYRINVKSKISFKELSNITGMSISEIRSINPSYIGNMIPVSKNSYINLPHEGMFRYLHNTNNLDRDVYSLSGDFKTNFVVKRVEKSVEIDNSISQIFFLDIIYPNIEKPEAELFEIGKINQCNNESAYRLQKGETLLDVSNKYQIDIKDLILWNSYSLNQLPKPGDFIILNQE